MVNIRPAPRAVDQPDLFQRQGGGKIEMIYEAE